MPSGDRGAFEPNATTMLSWRTIEGWLAGIAIFIQTGAAASLLGGGSVSRLVLPLSYALTLLLLVRCRDQLKLAVSRSLPMAILIALPFVSVLWSISGSITLRRAIALLCSVALAYALAIRFTPRQLAVLVVAVLGSCMLLSLVFAVALPSQAWMPSGTGLRGVFILKNILGWNAAVCVLASAGVLGIRDRRLRSLALLSLVAALVCLAASGSMTGILSLIAAGGFTLFYTVLARLRGAGRTLFVLIALQFVAILAISISEFLVPTLEALGRDATLTGRVPLWRLVDPEIGRHLMLGVGYQAFWTDANPDAWAIWGKLSWAAPHAHSGYRDTMLNFGIVGAAIFVAAIVRAMLQGATLVSQARRDGWLWLNVFAGMFLVMNLTESLFLVQNDFLFVLYATAIIMFGMREPELARDREVGRRQTLQTAHAIVDGIST